MLDSSDQQALTVSRIPALAAGRNAAVVWAIVLTGVTIVPGFLAGSLAVEMRREFPLSEFGVGLAFAGFWLVGAIFATPFATLTRRIGILWTLRLAAGILVITSLAIAALVHDEVTLIALVGVSGLAPALAGPATSIIIMSVISMRHQALALTMASASPPLGLMGAGLAVSALTGSVGWRGLFVLCAALGLLLLAVSAMLRTPLPVPARRAKGAEPARGRRALVVMLCGVVLANAATGGAVIYIVAAAPDAGIDLAVAAMLVAIASAVSIVFRMGLGAWIDVRRADPFGTVIMLLAAGAAGYVLLAVSGPLGYVGGVILALIPGWAWVNLLLYGVLGRYRDDVVVPTGMVQTTFFVGSVVGPLAMGALVSTLSYTVAWSVLAAAVAAAAITVAVAGRRLPAFVRRQDPADPAP